MAALLHFLRRSDERVRDSAETSLTRFRPHRQEKEQIMRSKFRMFVLFAVGFVTHSLTGSVLRSATPPQDDDTRTGKTELTFFAGFSAPAGPRADHPSLRYLVHLNAPGWNVIGATAPWRPGVAIGHNDRIAWDLIPEPVDTQDVYADQAAPAETRVFKDSLRIRGRNELFDFIRTLTSHNQPVEIPTLPNP